MNGAALLLDPRDPADLALVCRDERGRFELTFGEVSAATGAMAAQLAAAGVGRGDVVVTVLGSRAEWVVAMLGTLHLGAVALPCIEQLRPDDLGARIAATRPRAVVTSPRHRELVEQAASVARQRRPGVAAPAVLLPDLGTLLEDHDAIDAAPARSSGAGAGRRTTPPRADGLTPTDPAIITFTSGTSGPAKAVVHGLKYIAGQAVQAREWLGAQPGELSWCTAAPGWSKSARNVFIAPWLTGAAALLHDARFDPEQRLGILREEQPHVLCMAPTEYRLLAKRTELTDLPPRLRRLVAAGEALDPPVLHRWHEASGIWVRDGYGQTETGQMTAPPDGEDPVPGSMGRPLPGFALEVQDGELVVTDPSTVPTFFLGYLDEDSGRPVPHEGLWHTGDRVAIDGDGNLAFVGRGDDVIVSSGYRIGPFEVESVLVAHPAVAEAAAVAAPDEERGSVVRAVVVLREGYEPSGELAAELQAHCRERTAPYKYPRIVDFAEELPKTSSGKVRRALLRAPEPPTRGA